MSECWSWEARRSLKRSLQGSIGKRIKKRIRTKGKEWRKVTGFGALTVSMREMLKQR